MYKLKQAKKEEIRQRISNRDLAHKLGVTEGYISQIINGRKTDISKLMAYAFCKAVYSELEIENLFDIF
jgi:plasmid maintenance system antidote protein VapI